VLANLALDGLEDAVYSALEPNKTSRKPAKAHVVRYADDFIVTGVSRELLEQRVKPAIEAFLTVRGLQLAPEKTLITHIARGFDFLGQNVRKYGDKLLIKPARKSVNALLKKVSEVLGCNKAAIQAQVILLLNPIIRGWTMYHRHVVAAAPFLQVDHLVWSKVWRWAKRRHPGKGTQWIKARYFQRLGSRDWVFACGASGAGQGTAVDLFRASTLPIQRHTKVRSDANPFDPAWSVYFQQRLHAH
jgi:RNA-directed DNA polymerase